MEAHSTRRHRVPALGVVAALFAGMTVAVLPATVAHAVGFSAGNLVVERVGTGSSTLSSAATPVFLNEYTTGGALQQAIALPTTDSGGNHTLTESGTAASEGGLSLSGDGQSLSLMGYDVTPGTGGVSGTGGSGGAAVARTAAIVNAAGVVDTSTALTDAYQQNNPRGAVTDGSGHVWVGGVGSGSFSSTGGVREAADGASTSTAVTILSGTGNLTNTRVPEIDGGQLYVSTDRVPSSSGLTNTGIFRIGSGLPTTGGQTATLITTTGLPANGQANAASPLGYAFVDRDSGVAGDDTLYVADQNHGIAKYSTADGTTWTFRGLFNPGAPTTGYTGIAVTNDGSGNAVIYATNAVENQLQTMTDTAAFNANINITSGPTTLVTAPANESLRGVAWAPTGPATAPSITTQPHSQTITFLGTATLSVDETGSVPLHYQWYQGDPSDTSTPVGTDSNTFTTPALSSTTDYWVRVTNDAGQADSMAATVTVSPNTPPTISTPDPLANAISDPTNPSATVTVGDAETPAASLTVTATASDNDAVAPAANVNITGSGATRTVTVTPAGAVGYANITLEVSDGTNTTDATLKYAVSVASGTPTTTRYYAGSSDASTEQAVGNGYMLVGDDENQALRLYDTTVSGPPVNSFDFSNLLNLPAQKEVDIEASARAGNIIYWMGSESNNSDGSVRPSRDRVFATQVNGTGSSTTLTFLGYYDQLKEDLLNWDAANGNQFNFAADAAPGVPSEGSNAAFNIEGLEFAPGSTSTAYVSFRAPIVGPNNQALIVPVTNFDQLTGGNPGTTHATFGAPILLNLGGRGIREIQKNADNQYLIIAGPAVDGGPNTEALYTWDGVGADAPQLRSTDLTPPNSVGPYEGVVGVPDPLTDASQLELVADSGETVWYGDSTIAKDLSDPTLKKADGDLFTLGAPVQDIAPVNTVPGPQSTPEGSALGFSAANSNGITVADADSQGNAEQVELSVLHGTLSLGSTNGIQQTGNNSSDVTVTGPLSALNAALDGTTYTSGMFHGHDTLTVTSNDLGNSNAGGPLSDTDTVDINVIDHAPVATADSVDTNENVAINNTVNVLTNDNDADGDPLNAVQVTGPANGLLTLHADGTFVYTPNQFFHGNDSFTYKANDGTLDSNIVTVSILVHHVNQPPVGVDDFYVTKENTTLSGNVVSNDTDVDGTGLVALLQDSPTHDNNFTIHSDGTFAYTPAPNYHGTDSFTYFAYDGRLTSSLVTVHINVMFVNHPPTGVNDSYSVNENGTLSGNVLSNDTDIDGQSLTAFLNDNVSNGTLTLHTNGVFTYSPSPHFAGTDSFTYFASDGSSFSGLTTVTITVNPILLTVQANNTSRAYGAGNPTFTVTFSGFPQGQNLANSDITGLPNCTTPATSTSPVGSYEIDCTVGTLHSTEYAFVQPFAVGALMITPVPLSVQPTAASRPYGAADPTYGATFTGFVAGDSNSHNDITGSPSCTSTATASSSPGSFPATCTLGTLHSNNYTLGNVSNTTLTVKRAVLTVTAANEAKHVGQANPVLVYNITGFANGQTLATSDVTGKANCTTTARSGSPAGTYPIKCTIGTLKSAKNYSFALVSGILTVLP
jgi:hypothetical protein